MEELQYLKGKFTKVNLFVFTISVCIFITNNFIYLKYSDF